MRVFNIFRYLRDWEWNTPSAVHTCMIENQKYNHVSALKTYYTQPKVN